jgi:hypothetical protein
MQVCRIAGILVEKQEAGIACRITDKSTGTDWFSNGLSYVWGQLQGPLKQVTQQVVHDLYAIFSELCSDSGSARGPENKKEQKGKKNAIECGENIWVVECFSGTATWIPPAVTLKCTRFRETHKDAFLQYGCISNSLI